MRLLIERTHKSHKYTDKYGHHFNEKLCLYAIENMYYKNTNGVKTKLIPITLSDLMTLASTNKIDLSRYNLLDCLYIANMCKADFLGSSILDNLHLLLYILNLLDDPDGYDGLVFNRWKADMKGQNIQIDWNEFI